MPLGRWLVLINALDRVQVSRKMASAAQTAGVSAGADLRIDAE
ncbi:MAG: hypothetical protein U9N48_04260 [Euryarchaeota archaeon]|nr:hypothetical protein [Euryarchaeota archaeon]